MALLRGQFMESVYLPTGHNDVQTFIVVVKLIHCISGST